MDDFRINPKFNDDQDFAYTEVVRGKDDRAGLRGCVDMDCCGLQFRALAVAEIPAGPKTKERLDEERKLLEEYLGDDAHRLESMPRAEWDGMWLEAKTQELADMYGKHRQRFARYKSPPGFWRTDFPTTQEITNERSEAEERQRDVVQQRYREAMRPGGRWLFKDE